MAAGDAYRGGSRRTRENYRTYPDRARFCRDGEGGEHVSGDALSVMELLEKTTPDIAAVAKLALRALELGNRKNFIFL